MAEISKLTRLLLTLTAISTVSQPAEAGTSIYVFSPDQSTVVKTGGFAGVLETYVVTGQFRLAVDSDTGAASFEIVDANLTDETDSEYGRSLNEIFNMTGLAGIVVNETTIEFEGNTVDGMESDVRLKLSSGVDSAHLTGNTTPPPNSADLFFYDVNALVIKKYAGGTGEPNNPYKIATAEDLMLLSESPENYDKHFILTVDIDLDPNLPRWKVFDKAVIAPDGTSFTGVFDGNGHVISHLKIRGVNSLGLFGILGSGGMISNLGLITVDVNGEDGIGGLVGTNHGSVTTSYSTGIVNGNLEVGGLVGANSKLGSIDTSHSSSEVNGSEEVGGLAGNNGGSITASFSTGMVTGNEHVGGLVGWSYLGDITASSSAGRVSGDDYVGGLVGTNYGSITTSYSTAAVSSTAKVSTEGSWHVGGVGGLVGSNAGSITTSYSTGMVNGPANVGGLVGKGGGSIANSYSSGSVSGIENVGGLVGFNWGIIVTNYSNGLVSGSDKVGGLVGYNYHKGNVIDCFWDIEKSSLSQMCGIQGDDASGCDDNLGKKTTEMQTASTFVDAGWDFVDETANGTDDIWKISEVSDYPRLSWEKYSGGSGTPDNPYQIATAEELMLLGDSPEDYDKHFILIADIDLDPNLPGRKVFDKAVIVSEIPGGRTGIQRIPFTGVFDGNNHTISHLTIIGESYLGLFGRLEYGAEVGNLGLVDANINSSGHYSRYIGSLVGENRGTVSNSYSTGSVSVSDTSYIGSGVGGLVGQNLKDGFIFNSYSTCSTNGKSNVGGLVGFNLIGVVCNSYSTGSVSGTSNVGGLIGQNHDEGFICNSYSTSSVNGTFSTGGLVGLNHIAVISNSFSTGSVSRNNNVGNVGGLLGDNRGNLSTVSNSFWDIETSGLSISDGGIGKTTAEMQTASTFLDACWDFVEETANGTEDIWWILEGQDYPRLWWESTEQ
jgi:hypothetical protein